MKTSTQNDFILAETGRLDIQTHSTISMIKYWFKVICSPEHKYINLIYKLMLDDIEIRPLKHNWATQVKSVLSSLGFYHVWLAQGVGDYTSFLSLFKQRLTDNCVQNFQSRLIESSRALFYRNIFGFDFQFYLKCVNIEKYRIALSKLRLSSHRLSIETGRWNRTDIDNRICPSCNILEDEFHFLFECNMYTDIRQRYLPRYYCRHPSMYKTIALFMSKNVNVVKNLAVFVFRAFEIRKELTR